MTGPTTTNSLVQILDDLISGAAGAALSVGESAAESAEPILALPVIKQLFEYCLGKLLVDFGSVPLQEALTKLVIQIQTGQESAGCLAAFSAYQAALTQGDPNAIASAKSALDGAFASLINYDGSSSPVTST